MKTEHKDNHFKISPKIAIIFPKREIESFDENRNKNICLNI